MLTNITNNKGGAFVGNPPEIEIDGIICNKHIIMKYILAALQS
jgi:hypothetical protein